jgi:hypothetical protein
VFGLLDLVKIREKGTTFSKKSQYEECLYEDHTLSSNPWLYSHTDIGMGVSKNYENLADN